MMGQLVYLTASMTFDEINIESYRLATVMLDFETDLL